MGTEKIKCIDCDRLEDPQIAAANGGFCKSCAKLTEKIRRQRREFKDSLASGAVFVPSAAEKQSAKPFDQLANGAAEWKLEPDYYSDQIDRSVSAIINDAAEQSVGHVFLVSNEARLNLSFNELYGICEFQNQESGDYFYAFTPQNEARQIKADQQVVQACPCCGVGMLWYPSRFHMPRDIAMRIFRSFALGEKMEPPTNVRWMDCGDISYTEPGRG